MAGLTLEQIKSMGGSPTGGLTLSQIKSAQTPVESKPGFFSSLVTDPLKTLVVKPGVRFGQALGNLIAPMLGATPEGIARANQQTRTFGGMEIEPQKAFGQGGARQIVGDAAKTASYLYTGGELPAVANQTLRGQILAGGLTGLKAGAVGGGAYSFGEAIQNAENEPASVAYQTMFGTLAGGLAGGVLGATLPSISAGLTKFKEYKDFDSLTNKLNVRNKEVFKPTSSQMADWTQAKVDPIKTFSQEFGLENIPTSNNTLQLDEFISQTDLRYKAGAEGFNTILRNSPEVISISQREANALNSIKNSTLTPSQKLTATSKIQNEFLALRDEAQKAGQLLGDDNVSVAYADNLKDRFWGATKYFGPEEASVSNEVNRKIGTAFKEGIENVITDTNVREYNKKLQELIYLKDFLESRNGKVPGTGGKMLRYTLRTVGAVTGGGGLGSIGGAITADQIAQAIASPTARTWLIRRQLSKLPPEVRKSLEQEAKQILENMAVKRAETLRLPPPSNASLVNKGRPIPVVPGGVEYTGGDLAAQSSLNREITQEATPNPMMTDNMNPIDKSVNPQSGFVNGQVLRTGAGASLGATAGFEKDEQGNVRYDVKKGLAGAVVGGVIGNKGKLGMSIEDVSKGKIDLYRAGESTSKRGLFYTDNPEYAKAYGNNVNKITIDPSKMNVKQSTTSNDLFRELFPNDPLNGVYDLLHDTTNSRTKVAEFFKENPSFRKYFNEPDLWQRAVDKKIADKLTADGVDLVHYTQPEATGTYKAQEYQILSDLSKQADPLLSEARKYKSAGDLGINKVYRATVENFSPNKLKTSGKAIGLYTTADENFAKGFLSDADTKALNQTRKMETLNISPKAKVLIRDDFPKEFRFDYEGGTLTGDKMSKLGGPQGLQDKVASWALKNGYDAVDYSGTSGKNIIILNPKIIK